VWHCGQPPADIVVTARRIRNWRHLSMQTNIPNCPRTNYWRFTIRVASNSVYQ